MYNELSSDYDRFVNWKNRLSGEIPFIIQKLELVNALTILDAGTGTGMHAIALAQQGYQVSGADISPGMIEKARQNAAEAGAQVKLEVAPFGALAQTFGYQAFDATLVLGNSLPHLLSAAELEAALLDFAACLRPNGLLLIQNRNFDSIMTHQDRWMEPQSHSEGDSEWLFQRFYDFDPDGLLTFNMVTLKRTGKDNWSQKISSSLLRPILQADLSAALTRTGFENHHFYGNMAGDAFDPQKSSNLVVTTTRHSP